MSTSANSTVEDAIEMLKRKHVVLTDSDLASALSVDKSTISSWRRRGSVPSRYLRQETEQPSPLISRFEYLICHVFLDIYEKVRREHPFPDDPAARRGWAFAMVSFQKRLERHLRGVPESELEEKIEAIRAAAISGDTQAFIDNIGFVKLP